MLYYSPVTGNIHTEILKYFPRTCFIMTQLGGKKTDTLKSILKNLKTHLKLNSFDFIDATSKVTGSDFLDKIWKMSLGCPVGIAVLTEGMSQSTVANIFYELGLLASLGKETLVIKCADYKVPSDFVRTEYVSYDDKFLKNLDKFLDNVSEREVFYGTMAEQLEAKPLLTLDYLRRAFLISGNTDYQKKAKEIIAANEFDEHTKTILSGFVNHA